MNNCFFKNDLKDNEGCFEGSTIETDIVVNNKTMKVTAHVSYTLEIIDASKERNVNNVNGIPKNVVEQNNQTDDNWLEGKPINYKNMAESMLQDGENVIRVFDTEIFRAKATIDKKYGKVGAGEPTFEDYL